MQAEHSPVVGAGAGGRCGCSEVTRMFLAKTVCKLNNSVPTFYHSLSVYYP